MKNGGVVVFVVVMGALLSTAAAQTAPAAASKTAQTDASKTAQLKQAPSKLAFKVSQPIVLTPGKPAAFNLCASGAPVQINGDPKHVNWDQLQADIGQKQCGGPFGTQPTSISGGDGGPYTFQLDTGSFPPLGMHLGLNGVLYGTPVKLKRKQQLLSQGPFRVCAVQLGGEPSCNDVPVREGGATVTHKGISPKGIIALGAIGGAGAVGAAVAASSLSSTPSNTGSSCTMSAPVPCGAFGPGDPPGCVAGSAFVGALQSYCQCQGFPSGYSLGAGITCP